MAKMEQKQGIKAAESHDSDIKKRCPNCGSEHFEEFYEPHYENYTDDPMYGGCLVDVLIRDCRECDIA